MLRTFKLSRVMLMLLFVLCSYGIAHGQSGFWYYSYGYSFGNSAYAWAETGYNYWPGYVWVEATLSSDGCYASDWADDEQLAGPWARADVNCNFAACADYVWLDSNFYGYSGFSGMPQWAYIRSEVPISHPSPY